MTETPSEYKLAVILSVPKAPLKEDVGAALEDANLFALLEVNQDALEDHIMDAVNISPATKAMVELVQGVKDQKQLQEEWIKNLSKAMPPQFQKPIKSDKEDLIDFTDATIGPVSRSMGKTGDSKYDMSKYVKQILNKTPEKKK